MTDCFDANVLLEALLQDRKMAHIAHTALSKVQDAVISPLSVHLYVYFGRKEKHVVADLLEDLGSYRVLDMGSATMQWAAINRQSDDFEDALQVACAVMNGCDRFITFDAQLARQYERFIDIQLLTKL